MGRSPIHNSLYSYQIRCSSPVSHHPDRGVKQTPGQNPFTLFLGEADRRLGFFVDSLWQCSRPWLCQTLFRSEKWATQTAGLRRQSGRRCRGEKNPMKGTFMPQPLARLRKGRWALPSQETRVDSEILTLRKLSWMNGSQCNNCSSY